MCMIKRENLADENRFPPPIYDQGVFGGEFSSEEMHFSLRVVACSGEGQYLGYVFYSI